jgi:hypothetical protein
MVNWIFSRCWKSNATKSFDSQQTMTTTTTEHHFGGGRQKKVLSCHTTIREIKIDWICWLPLAFSTNV